jgi:hypothetical protein
VIRGIRGIRVIAGSVESAEIVGILVIRGTMARREIRGMLESAGQKDLAAHRVRLVLRDHRAPQHNSPRVTTTVTVL